MKTAIKFVLFATSLVAQTWSLPYAQLIPIRVVEEQPVPATYFVQPEVRSSKNAGQSIQPQCPCATCRCSQRTSLSQTRNVPPVVPIAEFNIEPRVEGGVASSGNSIDSPLIRYVRSALEEMTPFSGIGEFPDSKAAIPREASIVELLQTMNEPIFRDAVAKKTQSQNSQLGNTSPEGYEMYYLRAQSFNYDVPKSKADTEEPKESKKLDNQRNEIIDSIEELSMEQWTLLMQQQDMKSMMEREFKNQESGMREIKRQLNLIRKSGESRDKATSETPRSESISSSSTTEVPETAQLEGVAVTTSAPDTTSTVPTTTVESIVSTERSSVPTH